MWIVDLNKERMRETHTKRGREEKRRRWITIQMNEERKRKSDIHQTEQQRRQQRRGQSSTMAYKMIHTQRQNEMNKNNFEVNKYECKTIFAAERKPMNTNGILIFSFTFRLFSFVLCAFRVDFRCSQPTNFDYYV